MRDIVADARRSPPAQPSSALGPTGDGPKGGWVNAPRLDDWRPPGHRHLDAQLDAEDRQWRAKREGR
jgi:hypothetical protein